MATGTRYLEEAAASLAALRRANPALSVALITDLPNSSGLWDCVIPLSAPTHSLRDKIAMRFSPWQNTLFLDTDTYVAANLDHLFTMLEDGFDLLAHQLFEGHNYMLEGVPDSFPEFNTGVIGFRKGPAMQKFFDDWAGWYDRYHPSVTCDQQSFRKAVYLSSLRHSVLTPEYNFRPLSTNFAITDLRIIHGRPLSEMPAVKKIVDVNFVHRAYVPRLGCVVSDNMTPGQAWRLWLAATIELLKTGSRPCRKLMRWLVFSDSPKKSRPAG